MSRQSVLASDELDRVLTAATDGLDCVLAAATDEPFDRKLALDTVDGN